MAVTQRYTTPARTAYRNAEDGLLGVSSNTKAQKAKYDQGYQQSQSVTDAQNKLRQVEALKPGAYQSKYTDQLNEMLAKITNPEEFKYNFNDDEIFKYYADLYTEKGRQASADTMAQAQAMTGGYGNSYAQSVGNQAYQQYLLNLYDKGMDMQNAAYQRFQDKQANNYNIYNTLQAADATDYGRYQDDYSRWENERTYAYNAAEDAYNKDYNVFNTDRDYWNKQAQLENQDYWADENAALSYQQLEEQIRQADMANEMEKQKLAEQIRQSNLENELAKQKLAEETRQNDMAVAKSYVAAILANGQMPSAELLAAAGLSYEDAMKMLAQIEASGGGGGSSGPKPDADDEKDTNTGSKNDGLTYYEYSLIKNADKVGQKATGKSTIDKALAYTKQQQEKQKAEKSYKDLMSGNTTTLKNNYQDWLSRFSKNTTSTTTNNKTTGSNTTKSTGSNTTKTTGSNTTKSTGSSTTKTTGSNTTKTTGSNNTKSVGSASKSSKGYNPNKKLKK